MSGGNTLFITLHSTDKVVYTCQEVILYASPYTSLIVLVQIMCTHVSFGVIVATSLLVCNKINKKQHFGNISKFHTKSQETDTIHLTHIYIWDCTLLGFVTSFSGLSMFDCPFQCNQFLWIVYVWLPLPM
jgi:hypothetical protein